LDLEAEERLQVSGRIREFLVKKVLLLEEVFSCAEKQSGLSYAENPLDYDNLLEQREMCILNIKKVDVILNGFLVSSELTDTYKEEIELLTNKVKETLERILVLDQENKASMASQLSDVKCKFEKLKQGRKGTKGYSEIDNITIGGAYTDNKR
jgi:hypothetical protein